MESGSLLRRASKCTQGHEPWAKNTICVAPHELRLLPGGNTTTRHLCATIRVAARDEDEASGVVPQAWGRTVFHGTVRTSLCIIMMGQEAVVTRPGNARDVS